MNTLASLNSSHFLPQKMSEVLAALNSSGTRFSNESRQAEDGTNDELVSLSDAGLALARRVREIGSAAVDMAQDLIATFAQQLFGDAAKGMSVTFDTASLSAMSGASAALYSSSGLNGSSSGAAVNLQDAADFVGKGQLTTADGHVYNFEVEVHYQVLTQAIASSSSNRTNDTDREAKPQIPVLQGLKAHFPGKLDELLRMLDHDKLKLFFHFPASPEGAEKSQVRSGNLNLRLLELLESSQAAAQNLNSTFTQKHVASESVPVPAVDSKADSDAYEVHAHA